ncbi:vWA domain-containing protein [Verrucomicrobiota bacterium sgz303538]
MRFLYTSQLAWTVVALVPVLLYLFRKKPRRVPVSSLAFFKSLAREHQESPWLRRLKRLLSFLLTLLVILGSVGALARLVISPASGEVRSVVVVVDRSASMGAKDASGKTRLVAAIDRVIDRLAGLGSGVPVMVIAFDRQAEIVAPKSFDRRVVERALRSLQVRPMEGESTAALRLASQLAETEAPAGIWFASDSPAPQIDASVQVTVDSLAVPLAVPRNIGITAFDVRRIPLESGRYEAFVQLQAVGPGSVDAKLEVRIDDTLTAVRELTLSPGGRENLLLPVTAQSGRILSVRVIANDDQLEDDNEVYARIPEPRPLKVLWISSAPDPFTQLALTAISQEGELTVFRAGPDAWPPSEAVDVALFQNWLPKEWPANLPAIVLDPPASLGPVRAERLEGATFSVEHLRTPHERHPVLHGVATTRLTLAQTATLASEGALEPLWIGPAGPVLAAGDSQGQRVVVLAVAPERSENLPLSASYPLLLGNAIHWVSQPKTEALSIRCMRTGDTLNATGTTLAWVSGTGAEVAHTPVRNGWTSLDRTGLWKTDSGDSGSAALLSSRETLLPAGTESASKTPKGLGWLRGDLSTALLALVLAALVTESWLFHRHAVY